ncbi:MAG: hypothetical protein LBT59_25265 [Clostridiales bacterium]|nr:hypothetical protein [Clostridiales bacterium]
MSDNEGYPVYDVVFMNTDYFNGSTNVVAVTRVGDSTIAFPVSYVKIHNLNYKIVSFESCGLTKSAYICVNKKYIIPTRNLTKLVGRLPEFETKIFNSMFRSYLNA